MNYKFTYIIFCSTLLLFGCDFDPKNLMPPQSKKNVIIVSNTPVTLTPKHRHFVFSEPGEVVGTSAAICFSLRDNFPLVKSDDMETEVYKFMKGISINSTAITTEDEKIRFTRPMRAWSKYGVILENDELAACLNSEDCESNIPIGTKIKEIIISSTEKLEIQGIYWESTNAYD